MPITILATDRALAAFFRTNSLICSPATWSVTNSLLVHWKRPETNRHSQSLSLPPQILSNLNANVSKILRWLYQLYILWYCQANKFDVIGWELRFTTFRCMHAADFSFHCTSHFGQQELLGLKQLSDQLANRRVISLVVFIWIFKVFIHLICQLMFSEHTPSSCDAMMKAEECAETCQ